MNNDTFNDETLSAFLDAELPEQQMEQIRSALLEDDNLANRLADLAMVDEMIAAEYDKINQQPLPKAINELLAAIPEDSASVSSIEAAEKFTHKTKAQDHVNSTNNGSNVISLWERTKQSTNKPFALAASIAVAAGLFATVFTQSNNVMHDNWQEVVQILDQQTSGFEQTLDNGKTLATQLTFTNQQGNFCRQFDVSNSISVERNIACRVNQKWELTLTLIEQKQTTQHYQTATSNSVLREQIEQMAVGEFLDKKQEQQVIDKRWVRK